MEIEALQEILREWPKEQRYLEKRALLRFGAYFCILFGGITIFVTIVLTFAFAGDETVQSALITVIAIIGIGGSALALGLWVLLTSRPIGLLVLGIVFCVAGLVFVSFSLKEVFHGKEIKPPSIGIDVILVGLGLATLLYYPSYKRAFLGRPGKEALKNINGLIKSIEKAKPSEVQDLIMFGVSLYSRWKGRLLGETAFLIAWNSKCVDFLTEVDDMLLIGKSDLNIKKLGKSMLSEDLKASFQIGERRGEGDISPEMMERYEAWKADEGTQGL